MSEVCPRCRKGKMFEHSKFAFGKFHKMHKHCPECGLRYEVEPGFFQGALYVSYAFSIISMIIGGVFTYYVLNDPGVSVYMFVVFLISLLILPISYRYSRVIFLYLFSGVKFDDKYT